MAFRLRRVVPLVLALAVLAALVAAPAVARADSLSWALKYAGPPNINDYPNPPTPVAGAFNAVSFSDQMTGWAVGARLANVNAQSPSISATGFVAVTHDGGQQWGPVGTPASLKQLYGVDAVAATDVWAVGAAGTVVHWDGANWQTHALSTHWATKIVRAVAFADADHGWVVGDGGGIAYTSDGGDSWVNVVTPGTGSHLNAVAIVDATTAIAVGDSGAMRRLVGGTVTSPSSGTSQHLSAVAFAEGGRGIVAGANATARRTVNGGLSWTPVSLALPAGYSASQITARAVALAGSDNAVITGTYQTVWRSFDGGTSWTVEQLSDDTSDDTLELRGVAFVGGSADSPFTVGRAYALAMNSSDNKARAYLGAWTDRVLPPPTAPNTVTTQRATPGPRIRVDWIDASADEDGFVVQRAKDSNSDGAFATVAAVTAGTTSWTDAAVDWDSTWYYRVRSYRAEQTSTWASSGGFVADTVAPTTGSDALGAYVLQAEIDLNAADDAGGSGVDATFYTIDTTNRDLAHEGSTFVVTGIGEHTIRFWSEDVAGNVEDPGGSASFTITDPVVPDTIAPVSHSDVGGSAEGTMTVRIDATDEGGSGLAATYYTFNGGEPILYPGAFPVSAPGTYAMEYWSRDAAGNAEGRHTAEFVVSAVAPPVTSASVPAYYLKSASISVSATDGLHGSGVASTFVSVDGGAAVATTTVRVTGLGAHSVSFWSIDELGNIEPATTRSFTIVSTPSSKGTPSTPAAIATHKAGASFTVFGYMKRYSKTYSAKLYFYKKNKSGTYVKYKVRTAKSSTALTFLRYAYTTSVPSTGKWRVRARRAVGSTVRYSGWVYFTVN